MLNRLLINLQFGSFSLAKEELEWLDVTDNLFALVKSKDCSDLHADLESLMPWLKWVF